MKKRLLGVKGRSVFLAFCCLLLAFVFWFVLEYSKIGANPLFGLG